MAKQIPQHRSPQQTVHAQQTTPTRNSPWQGLRPETLWSVIAAGWGTLLILSFLAPVDSVSVFLGTALPQNLGWLLLAALAAFASRNSGLQVRASRTELAIVGGGLSWLILVTWLSSGQGNGRAVWNGFWQVLALGTCFYLARALIQLARIRAAVLLLLIVGCTALSIEGLQQVFVSLPASRADYAKDPDRMLAEQGIDAPPGSPRRQQFEDRLNSPEPFATFALANSLATLLCLGVMLTSGRLANCVVGEPGKANPPGVPWQKAAGLTIALAAQLICLLLTRSRTAYLALAFSLALWLILTLLRGKTQFSSRSLRIGGGAIIAVALLGLAWLFTVDSLVWREATKSILYRLEYWQAALTMIRDHAWTGVGLGNFQAYYPQYKLEQASEIISDPHNWILDIAASLSLPIAGLLVGWVGITLAKGCWKCLSHQAIKPGDSAVASSASLSPHEGRIASALLVGAAGGGLVSAAVLALTNNLALQTSLIAWGIAAGLGWSAWRCGAWAGSTANLLASAVAVLLCQLASGSWQASGIAVPLLAVMAMHWQQAPADRPGTLGDRPGSPGPGSPGPGSWGSWVATGIAAAALGLFVVQTWRPVTESWMWTENAAAAQSPAEQLRCMELAAAADPLDIDRRIQYLQMLAAKATAASDAATFTAEATRVLAQLELIAHPGAVGYVIPKVAAEVSLQLASNAARRGLPNLNFVNAAQGFYNQAAARYPSSVELRVQHAAASALVGDWLATKNSVAEAVRISEQTGHRDKKLAAQLIFLPLKPPGFEGQSDYIPAELLADWLRKEAMAKLR